MTPIVCFVACCLKVAEASSHEIGHNFGLDHDNSGADDYYTGHSVNGIYWGPIMGTGYGDDFSHWVGLS